MEQLVVSEKGSSSLHWSEIPCAVSVYMKLVCYFEINMIEKKNSVSHRNYILPYEISIVIIGLTP